MESDIGSRPVLGPRLRVVSRPSCVAAEPHGGNALELLKYHLKRLGPGRVASSKVSTLIFSDPALWIRTRYVRRRPSNWAMNVTHFDAVRSLADADLMRRAQQLAERARGVTVELIAHLAEIETRDLHLAAGYDSMFTYCCLCGPPHNRGYVADAVMLRSSAPTAPMAGGALANRT